MRNKGYIVMQVGYEYNDEYYHTGNNGETYDAPEKVFTNKIKAVEELERKTIDFIKGEDLGRYGGNGLEGICKEEMIGTFERLMMQEFEIDTDDYELEIPKDATDEQVKKIIECLDINFFKLIEVELD